MNHYRGEKKELILGPKKTYIRIEHEGSETICKLKLVKCVSKASYPKGGRTFNLNAGWREIQSAVLSTVSKN